MIGLRINKSYYLLSSLLLHNKLLRYKEFYRESHLYAFRPISLSHAQHESICPGHRIGLDSCSLTFFFPVEDVYICPLLLCPDV